MRILICGGGVGGLTLAYWLRRRGFEPVVVERAPHGRLGGYGIDVFGTGYDVAARMGLVDRLVPERLPVDSVDFVDGRGRPFARLTSDLLDTVTRGSYLGLMHTTLEEALLEAVLDDVDIRFGRTITGVRQNADGVEVDLGADGAGTPGTAGETGETGGTERFDLLVGADGIHSVTRDLVFGPETSFARYLGCRLACYPVPDRYGLGPVRAHYTEPGRQVVVYPTGRPGELIALFLFRARHSGPVSRTERLDVLGRAFDGMGWITPSLLDDAPDSEAIFMDTLTQIVLPAWFRGRVTLIGDACGSMTMVSAQGVSMAMGGAHALAEELEAAGGDHGRAFRDYERRMRGEVARRQRTARAFARSLVPGSRVGVGAQNLLSRVVMRETFAPLLRRQFGATSVLPPEATVPSHPRRR